MRKVKEFSKEWFRRLVESVKSESVNDPQTRLDMLIHELDRYVADLDRRFSNVGKGISERKRAAIAENAKKGGWKKGVPRKHVEEEKTA